MCTLSIRIAVRNRHHRKMNYCCLFLAKHDPGAPLRVDNPVAAMVKKHRSRGSCAGPDSSEAAVVKKNTADNLALSSTIFGVEEQCGGRCVAKKLLGSRAPHIIAGFRYLSLCFFVRRTASTFLPSLCAEFF